MKRLEGRVAIITGGARGMGAAHARAFVDQGARVVITDILDKEGQALADELGSAARFAAHDVASQADWTRVVELAEREFGPVSILVNNAGLGFTKTVEETSEADFVRTFEVNQLGIFLGMKAVLESMKAAGGSIINISSLSGLVGEALTVAYTATKFAVTGMTKVASREFGNFGVRVNSVHPGLIDTPMLDYARDFPEFIEKIMADSSLGRVGRPEEVSNLVVFLASDEASFITGSAYVIDGGSMK